MLRPEPRIIESLQPVSPGALNARGAAEYLGGISDRTLYSLTWPRGPIRCIRPGGPRAPRIFPVAELDRYLRELIEDSNQGGETRENTAADRRSVANAAQSKRKKRSGST